MVAMVVDVVPTVQMMAMLVFPMVVALVSVTAKVLVVATMVVTVGEV